MLPDWDFAGDEAKRRDFIYWVMAELDRYAMLTTAAPRSDDIDWASFLRECAVSRDVGRPSKALEGLNGMVWDYLLCRYMFDRYWPGRRRREIDPASAISIAVIRSVVVPRGLRETRDTVLPVLQHEAREALVAELKRGVLSKFTGRNQQRSKSLGRVQAEADIALLEALPAHWFAF
jgi:hypothetical protein